MTDIGTSVEHVDVLIIGAGISGIGAAAHLVRELPEKTFVVLDALDGFGGTWWTHRYPGVRSDSDLFTFGYSFKPWLGNPIATGDEILSYLGEVIDENHLAPTIRYRHRIVGADWSSDRALWTVHAERTGTGTGTGESLQFTASFLWMCQGYYRHDQGYTPEWPGFDEFQGQIIHPQHWPADTDLSGKRVVVIGSGATAATLIPAIADQCEHVTMLQRSPTFFVARPNVNELADTLRSLDIPPEWTHEIVRRKVLKDSAAVTQLSFDAPDMLREYLIDEARKQLPEGFDVDKHFSPAYRPWQQRLAALPDGDMFTAIRNGRASVVTDTIESFTPTGIRLGSGEMLDAEVVITATGFDLSVFGDVAISVDGELIAAADTVTYRGVMFTGIPNLAYVFGYFRASWTLRADLISGFVCRLLAHMDANGETVVVPALRDGEDAMELQAWVDPENFNPGYLMRSMHLMPKQGANAPWQLLHDYDAERQLFASPVIDDGALHFS